MTHFMSLEEELANAFSRLSPINKGYVLAEQSDLLSAQGMLPFLDAEVYPYGEKKIHTYKVLESTNITAKQKAFEGATTGTIIIAEEI